MVNHLTKYQIIEDYNNNKDTHDTPHVSLILNPVKQIIFMSKPSVIKNYFRFVAVEDSNILLSGINAGTGEPDNTIDLQYSKDGKSWSQYDFNDIPLNAGETLYMKGNNSNGFSTTDMETGVARTCSFGDIYYNGNSTTGKYECHGNIMSLIYGDNFEDKTTIPSACCFNSLFIGCTGLLSAPELPATILTDECYDSMFSGCTSLVNAPELSATTLAYNCYGGMFSGCTSLVNAPKLPVTTLTCGCYNYMFDGCTSLVNAPKLPATTLEEGCYSGMFFGCISLTTTPELPATTLALGCYESMFQGCTSLTTAPELPAATLSDNCYTNMFSGCTSLTEAPELLATILVDACYAGIFDGCSNLNYIKMLATDISAFDCLYDWVKDVAGSGTFTKNVNMTSLSTGTSGIPSGWTVEDYSEST